MVRLLYIYNHYVDKTLLKYCIYLLNEPEFAAFQPLVHQLTRSGDPEFEDIVAANILPIEIV